MENTINLNDLANVVNLIDYGFSKGIFVGPDVQTVAELRNRFSAIVEEAKKKEEEAKKAAENTNETVTSVAE